MIAIFWTTLFICLSAVLTFENECNSDSQCPTGKYCFENICKECWNCSEHLFRENIVSCPKNIDDCGDCSLGYEEVKVTARSLSKPCVKSSIGECAEDNECGRGYFCYQESSCTPCIDCAAKYHRFSPVSDVCAKQISDCGLCLSGYEDVPVTYGSPIKPCQWIPPAPLVSQNTEVHVNISAFSLLGACGVVIIIVLSIFFIYRSRNNKQAPQISPLPPPYTDCEAAAAPINSEVEETVCTFYKESPEDGDCMARIFQLPQYLRDVPKDQVDSSSTSCECGGNTPFQRGYLEEMESSESNGAIIVENEVQCSDNTASTANYAINGEPISKRRK